jgi:hypothetical protein
MAFFTNNRPLWFLHCLFRCLSNGSYCCTVYCGWKQMYFVFHN